MAPVLIGILLCSMFVSAFTVSCKRSSDCTAPGVILCKSGQTPTCTMKQCYCKTRAWCTYNSHCRDDCDSRQIYDCRRLRCYCGGLSL